MLCSTGLVTSRMFLVTARSSRNILLTMYSGVSQLESHVLTHYWISIMHVAIDYEFDNIKPTLTLTTSSCLLLRVDDKLVSNSTPDGVFDG